MSDTAFDGMFETWKCYNPIRQLQASSVRSGDLFMLSKLISLQPINSPFGFRQYRLSTLHFAKSSDETGLSCLLRASPTAVLG